MVVTIMGKRERNRWAGVYVAFCLETLQGCNHLGHEIYCMKKNINERKVYDRFSAMTLNIESGLYPVFVGNGHGITWNRKK